MARMEKMPDVGKRDWKKDEKGLYQPGATPVRVEVPECGFFVVAGKGDPNLPEFGEAVGALYALSYGVKFLPKKGPAPAGYHEFSVYPLEGVWDLEPFARDRVDEAGHAVLDKSALVYEAMIRQPDFVTQELAALMLERTEAKIPVALRGRIRFERRAEGVCVQMMHLGPYDAEPASFERIGAYCAEQGLSRTSGRHREIYLSNPGRTTPDKMRTVLRVQVR
jgi:hypothetical protein